ncbi:zeta toxin family protein [Echinicola marina]|uniref:zeta toxin family protein n=1 Tax=Echinicola marina TaxID=2859768 RepID=UPI001CF6C936|nr:zeta toxin family protein [Echinicola marina]UCS92157.1 zeta toxin family protein [Echinicola marina]
MPQLLVIAGCNGAGKSSFSQVLSPDAVEVFDYDKHYLRIYQSLIPTEFQETMAHNMAFGELEKQIQEAIDRRQSFSYETNFNSTPLHWPAVFKKNHYEVNMIYFCLDSIAEAKRRVAIRVENNGHYVPDAEIEKRFREGYANLNKHFEFFDNLHLFNSSFYNRTPQYCVSFQKGKLIKKDHLPHFFKDVIPALYSAS